MQARVVNNAAKRFYEYVGSSIPPCVFVLTWIPHSAVLISRECTTYSIELKIASRDFKLVIQSRKQSHLSMHLSDPVMLQLSCSILNLESIFEAYWKPCRDTMLVQRGPAGGYCLSGTCLRPYTSAPATTVI